jgi:hypothetical protein
VGGNERCGPAQACSWFFKKASDRTGVTCAPFALPPTLALDAAEGAPGRGLHRHHTFSCSGFHMFISYRYL